MPIACRGRIPRPARTDTNRRGTKAVRMEIGCSELTRDPLVFVFVGVWSGRRVRTEFCLARVWLRSLLQFPNRKATRRMSKADEFADDKVWSSRSKEPDSALPPCSGLLRACRTENFASADTRLMPQPAQLPHYSPRCDSKIVGCLDIDDFAHGHLMVLPKTDQGDTTAVFPYGVHNCRCYAMELRSRRSRYALSPLVGSRSEDSRILVLRIPSAVQT